MRLRLTLSYLWVYLIDSESKDVSIHQEFNSEINDLTNSRMTEGKMELLLETNANSLSMSQEPTFMLIYCTLSDDKLSRGTKMYKITKISSGYFYK